MSKPEEPERADIYTITDLEQIKVVSDPLRLRILGALCEEERTTKQVAGIIGEKPTRLYHHVEALERVGLIRPTRTRQNRGTVEKYYLSVARCFKAGSDLFSGAGGSPPASAALESVTHSMFETTAREMREQIAAGAGSGISDEGLLTYGEVIADPETVEKIRARLVEVLEEFREVGKASTPKAGDRRFRLLLTYFPLDRGKP